MLEIFDSADVDDLLEEFGSNCKIYSSRQCSCVEDNAGRWDPTDDCYFGYRFNEPIDQRLVRTAFKMSEENINLGMLFQGGCRISFFKYLPDSTPNPIYKTLSRGDVIVNLDDSIRKTQFLTYSERDHLWAFNVTEILKITAKSKVFQEGKDYKVEIAKNQNEKTRIIWTEGGDKPDKNYAVDFMSNVNYWVYSELPRTRGSGDDSTPKVVNCVLRPYSEKEAADLLQILDYTSKPEDNINV